MLRTLITFLFASLIAACSNQMHRNAPLVQLSSSDRLFDSQKIRAWGDQPFLIEDYLAIELERSDSFDRSLIVDEEGTLKPQHYLTISGGGANGAYGAGLMNGLTKSGQRPEYRFVTGISTGAILGLYAFLGEDYNHKLEEFYTQTSDEDLYQTRYFWQLFSSPSLLDTSKFEALVRDEIDREMMDRVKEQHLRGRTFLVKTTDLDSQRPVIWNMGVIAMLDGAEAEYLFESVIIASASIPGLFEPVLIPVEVDGVIYDELHVDGGVVAQVFFIPEDLDIEQFEMVENSQFSELGISLSDRRESHIWLINNSRIGNVWQPVQPRLTDITGRSISTMLKHQGRNNLVQIYKQSQLTNSTFNLSYINHQVPDAPEHAPFDQDYMQHIYCYGYAQGLNPHHWSHRFPDNSEMQATIPANNLALDIKSFNWERVELGLEKSIKQCLIRLRNEG
ncbi:patatin-like phospholipase family protein [Photobacterium rosenbergii]|uniref:Patatin-like phospholipase family protein n=1 Tax=Photobacterium rosenbergii TaxID=294936 RepID=A0ABU3ZHK1_9GAMM|nr:patatin-like phospholipase family protein [Photobacterium rosenbergii]MDV5169616.1 patatin-like phospholipase family protein [Photobacterium rosenbergii]